MSTQCWFRNPHLYIRECAEVGEHWLAWDKGFAIKKRVDPQRQAELYFPAHADYRILVVGSSGTPEYRRGSTSPVAVYPTWDYEIDSIVTLEELMASPVQPEPGLPIDENAVAGQEHRVVVTNLPIASTNIGRKFIRTIREMQEEYPDCILHVHGLYSYKIAFGMGFRAVDVEPREPAAKGTVTLPNGREVSAKEVARMPQWVNLLGFHTIELQQPRMRCMFNIKSARWASLHYGENFDFRVRRGANDLDALVPTKSSMFRRIPVSVGDRFVCDACSLQDVCKYYRAGGVCTIPGTDTAKLAQLMKSGNADQIIDGLGDLLEMQINRVAEGRENEAVADQLDPEVGRSLRGAYDAAVTLAKLLDPTRFSAAGKKDGPQKVLNTGGEEINPAQLVAEFMRECEKNGIDPASVTPRTIEALSGGTIKIGKQKELASGSTSD